MTTIAYDGRYIAADGRETMSTIITNDSVDKSIKTDKGLFFLCGQSKDCKEFAKEFAPREPTKITSSISGFLYKDKEVYWVGVSEGEYFLDSQDGVLLAAGSGRDYAISAMDHGKSAVDAVRYAITRDSCSGGKIICFDTSTGEFIKVKQ